MFKIKKRHIVYISFATLLVFCTNTHILIENQNKKVIYYDTVESGDEFSLSSIHSVSLTPIIEKYYITEDYLINNTMTLYFDQGGAGLPDELCDGEIFTIEGDGSFLITRRSNLLDEILLYADKDNKNEFFHNGEVVLLSDINKKWETYRIAIVKHNLLQNIYYLTRTWLNEI